MQNNELALDDIFMTPGQKAPIQKAKAEPNSHHCTDCKESPLTTLSL